jgi:hypothetical protein
MAHQGFLLDNGAPASGIYSLASRLFTTASGGTQVWAETQSGVAVTDGVYGVTLGSVTPLSSVDFNQPLWLEVQVGATVLAPRTRVAGVPYALGLRQPLRTLVADNPDATGTVPALTGRVHTTSANAVAVLGEVAPTSPGASSAAVRGRNNGTGGSGIGVWGSQEGSGFGVYGTSVSGLGVYGYASGTTNTNYGVYGRSESPTGVGVEGFAAATSGVTFGLFGRNASTSGFGAYAEAVAASGANYGMYGRSNSTGGTGVFGWAAAGSGLTYGVQGVSSSSSGKGVYGEGGFYGVQGNTSSTIGSGVVGYATATSGYNYGVQGWTNSPGGTGVHGWADAESGTAYGVWGHSSSPEGRGVVGTNFDPTGVNFGVYGESASPYGTGVYGVSTHPSAFNYAIWGKSLSSAGVGVVGEGVATSGDAWGVWGLTNAPSGRGVYGVANASTGSTYGVFGRSWSSGGIGTYGGSSGFAGVYGINHVGGWAIYAEGSLRVNGTLSKAGGSFEIDHPLDPEGRVLRHSFVESPDMMNVYNGNATTDERGYATVTLPDYFEALNRDFRYQLTVIGQFAQAIIAERVRENRFAIQTDKPHVEVSWQVTGVRRDAWAEAHRIVVEEDKPADQQGRYFAPEAHGRPREEGIGYLPNTDLPRDAERPPEGPAPGDAAARGAPAPPEVDFPHRQPPIQDAPRPSRDR